MDYIHQRELHENGYTILKGILNQQIVEKLKYGADKLVTQYAEGLVAKGKIPHTYEKEPFEKRFLTISKGNQNEMPTFFRPELHIKEFYDLFCNKCLLEAIHQAMPNAENIRIYPNYSLRPKLPDYAPHEITWHQDSGLTAEGYVITSSNQSFW